MVEKLKELKDELLMQVEQDMNEGRSADPKMIDSIKDLAEAEKACWEAEYYRTVTEAMEDGSMGYEDGMSYAQGGQGGSQGGRGYGRGRGGRRGYRGQPRDSMGRYTRRGYRQGRYGHDDIMQDVKEMMMSADPQEKEQIKQKLRQMADM